MKFLYNLWQVTLSSMLRTRSYVGVRGNTYEVNKWFFDNSLTLGKVGKESKNEKHFLLVEIRNTKLTNLYRDNLKS